MNEGNYIFVALNNEKGFNLLQCKQRYLTLIFKEWHLDR